MKSAGNRRLEGGASKAALSLAALLVCWGSIEAGYRLLDPFPYISPRDVNSTEHGNLSEHDPTLGWRGVANGEAELVTPHNRVWLAHNSLGFRDLEHGESDDESDAPSIVFLGDSFTWGYEVEFDDMFVNRLRGPLDNYQVYNLAHRGHGTDQQLLTFKGWRGERRLQLVVLMFSENDVDDNNASLRSRKRKPRYEWVGEELALTGTPVPKIEDWVGTARLPTPPETWRRWFEGWLFQSHALHDIWFRLEKYARSRKAEPRKSMRLRDSSEFDAQTDRERPELRRTSGILRELKREAEASGAELLVFFVPSRSEFNRASKTRSYRPYQDEIASACRKLGIVAVDLAPAFRHSWYRTYYRGGGHWTPRGHQVAADAMREPLLRALAR